MTKSRGIRRSKGSRQAFVEHEQGNHVCACGCGSLITVRPDHIHTGVPKFIHGHNSHLPRSPKTRELWAAQGPAIARRYMEGATYAQLAREFDTSIDTARRIAIDFGATSRNTAGRFTAQFGSDHPFWKGGTRINAHGYREVWVPSDSPYASMRHTGTNYVYEHRLIMAKHLERPLRSWETVHHINGVRDDNRLENLQLRSKAHGQGVNLICQDCGSANILPTPLD